MKKNLISSLNLQEGDVAKDIHRIFQRAYQVEAKIIGVDDFPPLHRSTQNLKESASQFFGLFDDGALAAVAEISSTPAHLNIESLVVDPKFFRKGYATQLLRLLLSSFDYESAIVETATKNKVAIALYKKIGFLELKTWKTAEGVTMVTLNAS